VRTPRRFLNQAQNAVKVVVSEVSLMRGLRTAGAAKVILTGPAFMQNVRRGRSELGTEAVHPLRVAPSFGGLAQAV
jgi:hypothetical protein